MPSLRALETLRSFGPKAATLSRDLEVIRKERKEWEDSVPPVLEEKQVLSGLLGYHLLGRAEGPAATVYFHGGGLISGSPRTAQGLARQLSLSVSGPVYLVEYPLAPEHPFPVARDELLRFYGWLRTRHPEVTFAGDSSGCCLALEVVQALAEGNLPGPRRLIFLSPHLDLSLEKYRSGTEDSQDPLVSYEGLRRCADLYLGGADAHRAEISPVFVKNLGLPPTLLLVGGRELLLADARQLADNNPMAKVLLSVYPGLWHVWPAWTELEESRQAFSEIGDFVKSS